MSELDEIQICLGCRKRINLLETGIEKEGFRCLDCAFYFCRPCAQYHFNLTDERPSGAAKRDVEIERLRGAEEYLGTKHDELLTKNTELRKENTRLRELADANAETLTALVGELNRLREALTAIQKSQRWETIYEKARAALEFKGEKA